MTCPSVYTKLQCSLLLTFIMSPDHLHLITVLPTPHHDSIPMLLLLIFIPLLCSLLLNFSLSCAPCSSPSFLSWEPASSHVQSSPSCPCKSCVPQEQKMLRYCPSNPLKVDPVLPGSIYQMPLHSSTGKAHSSHVVIPTMDVYRDLTQLMK